MSPFSYAAFHSKMHLLYHLHVWNLHYGIIIIIIIIIMRLIGPGKRHGVAIMLLYTGQIVIYSVIIQNLTLFLSFKQWQSKNCRHWNMNY